MSFKSQPHSFADEKTEGHSKSAAFESLVQNCDAGIIATDPTGRITYWNAAAERYLGVNAEQARGQTLIRFFRPDLHSENLGFLEMADRGHEVPAKNLVFSSDTGEARMATVSARSFFDSGGARAGLALTVWPAAAASPEMPPKAARHPAVRRIIAYLSHEVRIPLASILGFAEMMYDSRQTVSERLGCISRIRNNVKHLTELMNDISDLSKVESGQVQLQPVTFSLLPELGEIFSLLQTHAWKKRLELRLCFLGPVPETVCLDAARLRQVLFNVVGELIEETERGTLEIEIQCEGSAQSDEMRLVFRVSGPAGSGSAGAEKTDAEERFEPFAQTFDRSGLPFGGQRLGLALARRVARLLGGDLDTASGKSFYQCRAFTLWLPAGSAREINFITKVSEGDLKVRDGSLFSGNSQPLDGMDVLLVEDSADIQILVRHFLKKFGASVELAENGEEGVARARERSYDVILMDLQLPLLNGFEATRQLRENGYRSPIIALTAHALSDVRERCLKNGFDEYMTKPIHAAALIQVLERYLPGQARHN